MQEFGYLSFILADLNTPILSIKMLNVKCEIIHTSDNRIHELGSNESNLCWRTEKLLFLQFNNIPEKYMIKLSRALDF